MALKRTMLVDKSTPLLLATNDRVFMNKGTEYTLEMKLAGIDKQTVEEAAATRTRVLMGCWRFVAKLHRPRRSADADWTPEQLALLAAASRRLKSSPLADRSSALPLRPGVTQSCKVDVPTRSRQMMARFQGKPMPELSLPGISADR